MTETKPVILKALTIWQPWASLIMIGAKPYEFRSWMPPRSLIGKRMVNHAAARKMVPAEIEDLIARLSSRGQAWSTALHKEPALHLLHRCREGLKRGEQILPLGCGLGTVRVGAPKVGAAVAKEFGLTHVSDEDYKEHSYWGWPMLDVEAWGEPVPMAGKQGIWNWPTPEGAGL